ncbi:hypothetical protein [Glutamicibacter sp.]|jgi:hypothetical protein|uniref:hypothetical protein n=1 Tax=Glutamicibacter sp. TaxID=1931995 RepID=UPI002B4A6604|nr:hypothetical protein [Glutamicibacter sp.]HJX79166.1 hypothetical protein [Glutamicibacter sp.]
MTYQTFTELCPVWSKRVLEGPASDVELRQWLQEIHSFQFCITGEAFGHRNIGEEQKKKMEIDFMPRCDSCYRLSNEIAKVYTVYRKGVMEPIELFIDHYNTVHQDGVKK